MSTKSKALQSTHVLHHAHWLILFLSLLLTIFAAYFSQKQLDEKRALRFERLSQHAVELILERMVNYEDALWSGVAMLKSNQFKVNDQKWRKYIQGLNILSKYPGVNGIGIIYKVTPKNLSAFLRKQREDGRPDFRIHPKHNESIYMPITHIYPTEGNEQAVGLDMAHEKNRFTAAKKAKKTGKAQITGPIVLVQDAGRTPGFLFYAPFYKINTHQEQIFLGMVYAPFVVKKLMGGVLSYKKREVSIIIRDHEEILYTDTTRNKKNHGSIHTLIKKNLYGRTWTFELSSNELFHQHYSNNQPMTILISGLIIDLLLLILFIQISRAKNIATQYADKATEELKKKNAFLESLNEELKINSEKMTKSHESDQARNAKLSHVLNASIHTCILVVNQKGDITLCNIGAKHILGFDTNALIGKNIIEAVHLKKEVLKKMKLSEESEKNREALFAEFIKMIKSKPHEFREWTYVKKNQETIIVQLAVSEINHRDRNKEYLFISTDITQAKKMERIKNDFISTVNHELRTPLTSIVTSLALVIQSFDKFSKEQLFSMLNIAYNNCERLIRLVNNILDIQKIEENLVQTKFSSLSLEKKIKVVIDENKFLAKKNDIKILFNKEKDIYLDTDSDQLHQVLTNILSNALKFSPKDSTIHIKLEKNDTYALIHIADEGPGIPKKYAKHIFEKFSQADNSSTRIQQGSGLGLHLSKMIMQLLKGDIQFTCPESGGTVFTILLPLK